MPRRGMACKQVHLLRRQRSADRHHLALTIAATLARTPCLELRGDVGRRLAGQRRIGRAAALSPIAMAARAARPIQA